MGSVFSPYYAWAGRRDPENHVCINVALYAPGANRWAMTERGRGALQRDAARFQVGPSALTWEDGMLTVTFDEFSLPWPGTSLRPRRIRGIIRFRPAFVTADVYALDEGDTHSWWPIAPAGDVEIACEEAAHCWRGHGYHDSNWGDAGLETGFHRWDWARARTAEGGAAILYDPKPRRGVARRLGLRFAADGGAERFEPPPALALRRGLWRVARGVPCDPKGKAATAAMLEDSPFYARSLIDTELAGERLRYVHESFDGDRFASPVVRAMLPFRMPRRRGT